MAEIRLEKQLIADGKTAIMTRGADLCQNLEQILSKLRSLETVYRTNSGVQGKIEDILMRLSNLKSGYSSYNQRMLDSLDQVVASYEIQDAQAAVRVNKQDGKAVAAMGIAGSGLAAAGFNFGQISTTASGAINKEFVAEKSVHQNAFKEGNYDFEYRPDGAVLVKKDGVALGFTTAENANKVTGGIAYDNWDTNRDHPYAAHNTAPSDATPSDTTPSGGVTSLGQAGDFHMMNEREMDAVRMTPTEQVRHKNSVDMVEVLSAAPKATASNATPSNATPSNATPNEGVTSLGKAGDFHMMNDRLIPSAQMADINRQVEEMKGVSGVQPLHGPELRQKVDEMMGIPDTPLTPERNTEFLSDIIEDATNNQ